jgi:DNA primase
MDRDPSWIREAKDLPLGGRKRIAHLCGGGNTLLVSHSTEGLRAWCFRCGEGWSAPPPAIDLAERLARLSKSAAADNLVASSLELPSPMVRRWADWPADCRLWLLKAGLCSADLPKLGAYYHPDSDRVVLPVFNDQGTPTFWTARAVAKNRMPKYLSSPVDKATVLYKRGSCSAVTLTEDILSAYKVGESGGEGWAMLGTSISRHTISSLLSKGCAVNVWLDPDHAGIKATAKVIKTLRSVGITCRRIDSLHDPKLIHQQDIKELLCPT